MAIYAVAHGLWAHICLEINSIESFCMLADDSLPAFQCYSNGGTYSYQPSAACTHAYEIGAKVLPLQIEKSFQTNLLENRAKISGYHLWCVNLSDCYYYSMLYCPIPIGTHISAYGFEICLRSPLLSSMSFCRGGLVLQRKTVFLLFPFKK